MADAWGIDDGYWDVAGPGTTPRRHARAAARRHGRARRRRRPAAAGPRRCGSCATATGRPRTPGRPRARGRHRRLPRPRGAARPTCPSATTTCTPSDGGPTTRLIVVPDRCHLPDDLRAWGWAVQLYAARSQRQLGHRRPRRPAPRWPVGGVGSAPASSAVSPLHAAAPGPPPGAEPVLPVQPALAQPAVPPRRGRPRLRRRRRRPRPAWPPPAGRSNVDRRIDRDRGLGAQARRPSSASGRASAADADPRLRRLAGGRRARPSRSYATFCALAEHHGNGLAGVAGRAPPARLPARRPLRRRARRPACASTPGCSGCSTASWPRPPPPSPGSCTTSPSASTPTAPTPGPGRTCSPSACAVGAPPDEFNPAGQDWGLPPFVPWRLRAAGYEPFDRARSGPPSAHGGGLRIDHVMGLFRLFWIPTGAGPGRRRLRALPGHGAARHRSPSRATGPGPSSSARTSAPSRTRSGPSWPSAASCPTGSLWFEPEPPREWPGAGPGRGHHPRPADGRRAVDRRRPAAQRAIGLAPNEAGQAGRPGPAGATRPAWTSDAPAGRGGRRRLPAARPRPPAGAAGHPRRRPRRGGAAQHARAPSTSGRTGRSPCPSRSRRSRPTPRPGRGGELKAAAG